MPTAFDLIGHNAALQEHWIRRLIAAIIDGILLSIILFIFNFAFAVFLWGIFLWPLFGGVLWWLYSTIFEGTIGATIGKKLVSLQVVAVDGLMDLPRAMIRNVSKVYWIIFLIDLLLGAATEGDPRQRYLDRIARTTVTRVDQQAYMEEQFRMMQHVPPRPTPPPPGAYAAPGAPQAPPAPSAAAPPPGGWPQQPGTWPGQAPPQSQWPQHQWDEEGRLKPEMKFCTACGGQLVARGDGKLTCVRCGAVY
ncbi:MAG TPA: RDD family protein [Thermoplasmata archaeon]|nr:RDD family protein [Thermoplasmata archaeon]